jgi:hypothetical protein
LNPARWGVRFRSAGPEERSLAWVFALGAGSALVLAPLVPRIAPFVPACPFHALTGMPCPGCGSTRALVALVGGDFAAALGWNPVAALAILGGWTVAAIAPLWVLLDGPLPALAPVLPARSRWLLGGMLALNWAYLLARRF